MVVTGPRICHVPEFHTSLGPEANELAARAGLILDDHQSLVLDAALGLRKDEKFAAAEVGVVEPRQNGKGGILEARELAGVEILGEKLIIHSAHEYATSLEAFYRMQPLLEEADIKIRRVRNAHGEQGFDFANGCRIRYRTRTRGGGRGFSCDCLLLDEAMFLPEFAHAALLPTMSARERPQVWYTGSAVDQEVHEHGIVLARVRERGIEGKDPSLAYFEWSLPYDHPDDIPEGVAEDESAWADANPAMYLRISPESVAREQRSLSARNFAVERLGVGDWPRTDGLGDLIIDLELWKSLADKDSEIVGSVVFCYDVSPDRRWATISAAGRRKDGSFHVETVARQGGTGWLKRELPRLNTAHNPHAVLTDEKGPGASLVPELRDLGVLVETVNTNEHAQACGFFLDEVTQENVHHLGTPELYAAIRGAAQRTLGDSWAWSRKNSSVDITPLVSATLAVWGAAHTAAGGLVY